MTDPKGLPEPIKWPMRFTWAGLLAERATQAFWPMWTLAFASIAIWGTGWLPELSSTALWMLIMFFVATGIGTLIYARRFRIPRQDEALARLDRTLPGSPIQALRDDPAIGADAAWACEE